ncbi:hypothetical protein LCGC14_1267270 [marine sediment metagenome]|uniref:Uncharacterized protein n=1 Tax=marine sediment metagenome TaxID=412755 RepID=A0A0F9NFR3_9ZZZZ
MKKPKREGLNGNTPKWFEHWHLKHFIQVDDRTKRNEKWIYIIIAAIIASGVMANGNGETITSFIKALLGVF